MLILLLVAMAVLRQVVQLPEVQVAQTAVVAAARLAIFNLLAALAVQV
jgi:hypothetical protein